MIFFIFMLLRKEFRNINIYAQPLDQPIFSSAIAPTRGAVIGLNMKTSSSRHHNSQIVDLSEAYSQEDLSSIYKGVLSCLHVEKSSHQGLNDAVFADGLPGLN
jgi:hypothetical protein